MIDTNTLNHLQTNSLTISHLMPCVTYQITVTPKITETEYGLPARTKATVIAEGIMLSK